MKKLTLLFTASLLLATAGIANAAPIYGQLKIGPTSGNTATVSVDGTGNTATLIDFTNNASDGIEMIEGTGDFAGVTGTGSIADINLNPFTPIDPLWSIDGFNFALNTITYNSVISIPNTTSKFVTLAGTGKISGNGFDSTSGNWTMSLDTTGGTFNWSSTVPAPATLFLLGAGLLGVASLRKKKAA